MKIFIMVGVVLIGVFSSLLVFGASEFVQNPPPGIEVSSAKVLDNSQEVPEGMEAIKVGNATTIVVPKGARVSQAGPLINIEGIDSYAARRFAQMEARLEKLERGQEGLKKQIEVLVEKLKKMVHEIRQTLLILGN